MTRASSAGAHGWRLRRRIGISFGVLGALSVLLIAAIVGSTVYFVQAGNGVIYRWQPAVINVERLVTDLVDQETGVRGYVLSGSKAFLAPYNDARKSETTHADSLRGLVGDDAVARARLDALLAAVVQWQRTVAAPAIQQTSAGRSAAAAIVVESALAKTEFDGIRTRASALSDEVAARTRSARTERRTATVVFIVALSLGALLIIAGGVVLWRGLHRWVLGPVDRLAAQTRVVASGQTHREIEGDGPLELTRLGANVESMRAQIAAELVRAEQVQAELLAQGEELARSNQDLQQFAYVASHDLSEPLRKVANFCQLLERQYADRLDDRARQYIDFAVDGARRMQVLITDLLELSRVGRTTDEFVPVVLDDVVDLALRTLADRVAEAGATVRRPARLPTVPGDRTLLESLFENLIGNAVKYRHPDTAPVVTIGAAHDEVADVWTFTVADNGIGVDAQYAERIFAVFQRLHLRDQYEGTGIGLALCRRIVEFHGGQIRLGDVVSATHGATFEFTLPGGGPSAEPCD